MALPQKAIWLGAGALSLKKKKRKNLLSLDYILSPCVYLISSGEFKCDADRSQRECRSRGTQPSQPDFVREERKLGLL